MARLEFRGAAAKCTAHADIGSADMSIGLDGDVSGWPTGASGRNFMVTLDRGTAKMEKILCSALSGTTLTVVTRGYDGTSAKTHSSGSGVEHGFGATVLDDYGRHVYDTTHNDHTQYLKKDGSTPFTGVASIVGTPVAVGTANANGSALTLARSDHVHDISDGAIDAAAKLADGIVNENKIAASVAGGGLTGGGGVPLAVNVDGATTEIASDAVRVKDGGITLAKFAAGQRPRFVVADAAGLAALTPSAGDVAWQVDIAAEKYYDGAAWWYLRNGPACRVFHSVGVSIADTTNTAHAMDSERYDRQGMHSTSSNTSRITVPTGGDGIYKLGAHVEWTGNPTGRRVLKVRLNGTTDIASISQETPSGAISYQSIASEYALVAGDYVEMVVVQTSGGALATVTVGNFSPEFWASFDSHV